MTGRGAAAPLGGGGEPLGPTTTAWELDDVDSSESALAERLRLAIARRDRLRPGTAAHWRASCEARALMKRLVAASAGGLGAVPGPVAQGRP